MSQEEKNIPVEQQRLEKEYGQKISGELLLKKDSQFQRN